MKTKEKICFIDCQPSVLKEAFDVVCSDSFHLNKKNEEAVLSIISDYLLFSKNRSQIINRNLKILFISGIEAEYRLKQYRTLGKTTESIEKDIEAILLSFLYSGECIYLDETLFKLFQY
ncbi:MAG: hypothetical protein QW303_00075 [Nitrososphaerota archaeon]